MRLAALVLAGAAFARCVQVARLELAGEARTLRPRRALRERPPPDARREGVLVLALDGINRDLLYAMLRAGELPGLEQLLGGRTADGAFPHAHFDETLVATLPSITVASWTAVFTGAPPAQNGVTGNEFFVRERAELVAPAPVSFHSASATLATWTDDPVDREIAVPTLYERLRAQDPSTRSWVALAYVYRGADELLVPARHIIVPGAAAVLGHLVGLASRRDVISSFDRAASATVRAQLEHHDAPDVLTVYFGGPDLYTHGAPEGPERAERGYLSAVLDPQFRALYRVLSERGALAHRYVVVTSDHGHTGVTREGARALATRSGEPDGPAAALAFAGFRVRPFRSHVRGTGFTAVLAYQGALAYVYLADRSRCDARHTRCDWSRPPRYEQDVLPAAQAFYLSTTPGSAVPAMLGALDMILTRRPRPYPDDDLPFEVYVGAGRTEPVGEYLRAHPHPDYVDLEARLRDLAVGRFGERAGDVLLIAHNGDRANDFERAYFAEPSYSWHGSPSRRDSEVPLIVAHPARAAGALAEQTRAALGERPRQQRVTDLILALRRPR